MSLQQKTNRVEDNHQDIPLPPTKKTKPDPIFQSSIDKSFYVITLNKVLCAYCSKDITKSIKIICAECPMFPVFCLECLIKNKRENSQPHNHSYYIIDNLNMPIFTEDWSLQDEFKLLSSVEKYGLDNWGDISDYMLNRGKVEVESHYYSFYYRNNQNCPDKNEFIYSFDNSNQLGSVNIEKLAKNKELENSIKEITRANQGTIPQSKYQLDRTSKRGRSIIKNRGKKDQSDNQSASEILGYWPKRNEFDIEFLNDAELEIAELEFLDTDSEADKKLKMDVLKAYNSQLDERILRKNFIINKGLLDLKRQMNYESRLSKEDREILNCLKPFLRFFNYSDFFDLDEGVVLEKNIKQKIYQLKQYQKQGFKTINDIEKYLEVDIKNTYNANKRQNPNEKIEPKIFSTNTIGDRINRFIKYSEDSSVLNENDLKFVKELPIPKTLFCEIKDKIQKEKDLKKPTMNADIEKILQSYDIEKTTMGELIKYFIPNKEISVINLN